MKRIVLFAVGCAVLAVLVWYAGAGAIGHAFAMLGISGVVLVALMHLPLIVLMGLAWRAASGKVASRSAFVTSRFVRDAAAEVLPFSQLGGFAAAVRVLSLKSVTVSANALSLFVDLVAEFTAKLPYTVAGLTLLFWLRPDYVRLMPLFAGTGLMVAAIILAVRFRAELLARFEVVTQTVLQRWTTQVLAIGEIASGFRRERFVPCFALHVLCWFVGAAETWVIFGLMHSPVRPAQALIIDSLANMLRTFAFFIPAAAGVQEGAYVVVGLFVGVPPASAVAFSLIRRAREFVLGVPALLLWQTWEAVPARRP